MSDREFDREVRTIQGKNKWGWPKGCMLVILALLGLILLLLGMCAAGFFGLGPMS